MYNLIVIYKKIDRFIFAYYLIYCNLQGHIFKTGSMAVTNTCLKMASLSYSLFTFFDLRCWPKEIFFHALPPLSLCKAQKERAEPFSAVSSKSRMFCLVKKGRRWIKVIEDCHKGVIATAKALDTVTSRLLIMRTSCRCNRSRASSK